MSKSNGNCLSCTERQLFVVGVTDKDVEKFYRSLVRHLTEPIVEFNDEECLFLNILSYADRYKSVLFKLFK